MPKFKVTHVSEVEAENATEAAMLHAEQKTETLFVTVEQVN